MHVILPPGLAVGLPDGLMGNSEVGHYTIGTGRVSYQVRRCRKKEKIEIVLNFFSRTLWLLIWQYLTVAYTLSQNYWKHSLVPRMEMGACTFWGW